jgi:predicted molibdopterin-dependent oxidoreductase YjgC
MFRRIEGAAAGRQATIEVDGRCVAAHEGASLALTLMQAGAMPMRHTAVSGAPRAPLCLMGVCFECLVQVDNQPNVQACMVVVRDGMQVRLQHGARTLEAAP